MPNQNQNNPGQKPGQEDQSQRQGNKMPGQKDQEWNDDDSSSKSDRSTRE